MKKLLLAVTLGAVAIALAGFFFAQVRNNSPPDRQALLQKATRVQPVSRAPDFALPDLDGQLHALSQWRGKVRLLNFWATWCGPCRKEIPDLIALEKQYRDDGFRVIGIATDESGAKAVKAFAKEYAIPYPLLMDNGHAPGIARHLGFHLVGLPASVLIGRQGRVASYHLGPIDPRAMKKKVEKLLNGHQKPTNASDQAPNSANRLAQKPPAG